MFNVGFSLFNILLNWNLGFDWKVFSRIWLKRKCSILCDARNGSHCIDCVLHWLCFTTVLKVG